MTDQRRTYTGFEGHRLFARGDIEAVAVKAKGLLDQGATERVAVYEDATGQPIDIDFRGAAEEVIARFADHPVLGLPAQELSPTQEETKPRGRGRPKLGVVAREVTLLPRHWEWLKSQRGGASATLRRLVEGERKKNQPTDRARHAQEVVHRFIWDIASDLPGFEEATRALFAQDYPTLFNQIAGWPPDVRAHVAYLAERATGPSSL